MGRIALVACAVVVSCGNSAPPPKAEVATVASTPPVETVSAAPAAPEPPPPPAPSAPPGPPLAVITTPDAGGCELMTLATGAKAAMPAGDLKAYSNGGPLFVKVDPSADGKQLVFEGRKPGKTTVMLVRKSKSGCLEVTVTP